MQRDGVAVEDVEEGSDSDGLWARSNCFSLVKKFRRLTARSQKEKKLT